MEKLEIKAGCENDWQMLQRISIETFTTTYRHLNTPENFNQYVASAFNEGQLKLELQNPYSHFYFAYENGAMIGYLKLNEYTAQTEPQGDDALEIERIYLYKNKQGKGYGKAMVDHCVQVAREKGKSYLWLGVWEKNPSAIAFYRKMGFAAFGRHIFTIGEDHQEDLLMRLPVV